MEKRIIKFRAWDGKEMVNTDNILIDLPIMQYTGINDINGIESYEGDIIKPVKYNDIPNVIVYIGNGFYRYKNQNKKDYYNILGNCEFKIIGNVYKNKL